MSQFFHSCRGGAGHRACASGRLADLRGFGSAALLGFALCGLTLTGHADEGWKTVFSEGGREVQLDRASVMASDGGTQVAWARLLLPSSEASAADHAAVHSLSRYDCVNRSFTTLRRRYVDARNIIVREEVPEQLRPQAVVGGTVDDRLWREICQPASLQDLTRIAREAERMVGATSAEVVVQDGSRERQAAAPVAEATMIKVAEAAAEAAAAAANPGDSHGRQKSDAAAVVVGPVVRSQVTVEPVRRALSAQPAGQGVAWSYQGDTGPARWGQLSPEWKLCDAGQRQSPVDLRNGIRLDLEAPRVDYVPARFRVSDSGRALEVYVGSGLTAVIRGHAFELTHLSFHVPSEVLVDGRESPLAVHFHHRSTDGLHAVMVVFFETGAQAHAGLQTVLNNLPLDRGGWYMPTVSLNPGEFLPDEPGHFEFHGSLSTPPCTEGVVWIVMKSPLSVSPEQLAILGRLHSGNIRPAQPLNNRLILETR